MRQTRCQRTVYLRAKLGGDRLVVETYPKQSKLAETQLRQVLVEVRKGLRMSQVCERGIFETANLDRLLEERGHELERAGPHRARSRRAERVVGGPQCIDQPDLLLCIGSRGDDPDQPSQAPDEIVVVDGEIGEQPTRSTR